MITRMLIASWVIILKSVHMHSTVHSYELNCKFENVDLFQLIIQYTTLKIDRLVFKLRANPNVRGGAKLEPSGKRMFRQQKQTKQSTRYASVKDLSMTSNLEHDIAY